MPRKKSASDPLKFDITPDELKIFLEGVNDCLDTMESGILHLEQKHDAQTLNEVFRAAHTLKAVVGTVGHHQMVELTQMQNPSKIAGISQVRIKFNRHLAFFNRLFKSSQITR